MFVRTRKTSTKKTTVTDFIELITTQSHLTDAERITGAAILAEIVNLRSQLEDAKTNYDTLRTQLEHSICSAEARLGLLSNGSHPLLRVPDEILGLIMEEAYFEPAEPMIDYYQPPRDLVEVKLSHVCRRWRHVAISTPRMWTNIVGPGREQDPIAHLEAYLARSKACAIDLELKIAEGMSQTPRAKVEQFLEIAARSSERWRSFKVCFSDSDIIRTESKETMNRLVVILQNLSVPNLRSMDLSSHLHSPITVAPRIFLKGAPRLSNLTIDAFKSHRPLPPLDSITTLSILGGGGTGAPIAIIPLLALPGLRHLSIVCNNEPDDSPVQIEVETGFEAGQFPSTSPSSLISLRIPIYNLSTLLEIPSPLRQAFASIKHLCVTIPGLYDGSDVNSDGGGFDDEWCEWPTELEEAVDNADFDFFPSLEHLTVVTNAIHAFTTNRALCHLTRNITTLTVLGGDMGLERPTDPQMLWTRLRSAYLEDISDIIGNQDVLINWLAERRDSLKVTLGYEAQKKWISGMDATLSNGRSLQEVKAEVDIVDGAIQLKLEDLWFPKDE